MDKVPERSEASDYYFTYIDQVGSGDIVQILTKQGQESVALFAGIPDGRSLERDAPDK